MEESMNDSVARLDRLLATQPLAVLATSEEGAPYASLVAVANLGRSRLYFATPRATRKWGNMSSEPRVALLFDDRGNDPVDFHQAAAATGLGAARECEGEEAARGKAALLERHPHLAGFLSAPTSAVMCVDVQNWYVASRFQSVDRIECSESDR
jgi:heme iron utilization protein